MGISRLRIGEISSPELGQGLVAFHAHRLMGLAAQELVGFIPFQIWKYSQTFYPTISWLHSELQRLENPCPHDSVLS